jgi:hypothetical protein
MPQVALTVGLEATGDGLLTTSPTRGRPRLSAETVAYRSVPRPPIQARELSQVPLALDDEVPATGQPGPVDDPIGVVFWFCQHADVLVDVPAGG